CSKHITGNRAPLTNFVEKFLGTVRFGNNDFAEIAGYGDVGSRCGFPTFPIVFRPFKTLCFFNYALMIRQDYDITSSLRRGALQVRFSNNDFTMIAGYGDVVIGSMSIKKVYYVECLGYNLFSVGQFCDKGLEVAFRKSTCLVRTEGGVDLLTGDHSSNLHTIPLNEVASNSSACLLEKASSSQSWLWHQRLSHLN
nr:integrase, catalytic region, zinc finger, CCHC-type, peptidase aspartic, catalytic [Tanacetum cinerariifolium]